MLVFDVFRGSEVVGTATVEKQGMFYLLRCTCTAGKALPTEIVLKTPNEIISCGRCVPEAGKCISVKRISGKKWDGITGRFELYTSETRSFSVETLRYAVYNAELQKIEEN